MDVVMPGYAIVTTPNGSAIRALPGENGHPTWVGLGQRGSDLNQLTLYLCLTTNPSESSPLSTNSKIRIRGIINDPWLRVPKDAELPLDGIRDDGRGHMAGSEFEIVALTAARPLQFGDQFKLMETARGLWISAAESEKRLRGVMDETMAATFILNDAPHMRTALDDVCCLLVYTSQGTKRETFRGSREDAYRRHQEMIKNAEDKGIYLSNDIKPGAC